MHTLGSFVLIVSFIAGRRLLVLLEICIPVVADIVFFLFYISKTLIN